jgi:hypothetical protein
MYRFIEECKSRLGFDNIGEQQQQRQREREPPAPAGIKSTITIRAA